MFNTSKVRMAMKAFSPTLVNPGEKTRQAAVAIILREASMDGAEQTEVLFIQRAERPGDPWSGQMAFPGGHREDSDISLQAAAMRETNEEIGLSLDNADYLGALNHQQAQPNASHPGQTAGWEGLAHFLHEPGTAVDGRKNPGVEAKIHDPFEMAVRRIGGVSGAVPADRHRVGIRFTRSWLGCDPVDDGTLHGVSWTDASACSSAD